ncbi:ABC transporter ATP-binding protein [Desulfovibrio inopinatus]|uniref:ABC transporter ATP-binding protein n=1 Tax=Desulfovibrio inopinatus TaxID=102109 RepID=UPI000418F60F|nr:ABC transporter ATP-binding protein [Desulfovibrio inopinatus]
MPFLEIKSLNVSYGDVQVIFDLSLNVNKGEAVSIIGGNGAGKTTLLKTLSGLLTPQSGDVIFDGQSVYGAAPDDVVKAGIIHVPEGRRLFSLMNVEDNLLVGAYNKKAYEQRKKTLEYVYDMFPRLRERSEQLAMTLSGGEQQMVAIARGLMALPKILMLDEPSLGLAPILMQEIFRTVRQIADAGTTVLLVEQDVRQSLGMSDRGYVLEHGRVAMEGPAQELVENPHVKTAYLGI